MKNFISLLLIGVVSGLFGGACGDKEYTLEDTGTDTGFIDPFAPNWAPWDLAHINTNHCPWPESIATGPQNCIPRCDENDICWLGGPSWEIESINVFGNWIFGRQIIPPGLVDYYGSSNIIRRYNIATLTDNIARLNAENVQILGVQNDQDAVLLDENSEPFTVLRVTPDGKETSKPLPATFSGDGIQFLDGYLYSAGSIPLTSVEEGGGIQRLNIDGDGLPEIILTNAEIIAAVERDVPSADLSEEFFPAEIVSVQTNVLWIRGRQFVCGHALSPATGELHCTWLHPENGWIGAAGDEYLIFAPNINLYEFGFISSMHISGEVFEQVHYHSPSDLPGLFGGMFYFGGLFYMREADGIIGFSPNGSGVYMAMPTKAFHYVYYWQGNSVIFTQVAGINQRGLVAYYGVYDSHAYFYNTVFISIPLLPCTIETPCPENYACSPDGYCIQQ